MFKTLVGASVAALLFSSVSFANVPGVDEGDLSSTPEMLTLFLANVDTDTNPVPVTEMFSLASDETTTPEMKSLLLANVDTDAAPIAPVEMMLLLADNSDADVLPTETNMYSVLLADNSDADVLPTETNMLFLFANAEDAEVIPADVG